MNASFDRSPCRFQLDSGHVVLIDPLALDALSQQLAEVAELPESERSSKLQAFGERGLRIGVQRVSGAAPGMCDYRGADLAGGSSSPTRSVPTAVWVAAGR